MKTPKRITDILKRKIEYIESSRGKMSFSVLRMQDNLLDRVIKEVVSALDVKNGVILNSVHNYRVMGDLDKLYRDFSKVAALTFAPQIGSVIQGISDMSAKYFQITLPGGLADRFEVVSSLAIKKLGMRLGLEGGEIVGGGFLEAVLQNQAMGLELKNFMARAITGQIPMREFTAGVNRIITGSGQVSGGYEKQFSRFVYDIYSQYDAAYNLNIANEFDMNHFIYQGGLIKESRDFCREHNDRVWTREEAEKWPEWTPADAIFITEFEQKDIYEIPSYLSYPGYDPLIDRGGYNCRHMIGWISEGLARELRPNLE